MKAKDLTGQKFGRLYVMYVDRWRKSNSAYYICHCECGNILSVRASSLTTHNTQSCGCLAKEKQSQVRESQQKRNQYIINGETTKIRMSNCDEFAIIDTKNIDKAIRFCWSKNKYGYVVAHPRKAYTNGIGNVNLHRIIVGNDSKMPTDHINRNKLDNRECNLRITTNAINSHNKGISPINTTGHKNIVWRGTRYAVSFIYCKKTYYLGIFDTIERAIIARNKKYNELGIKIED